MAKLCLWRRDKPSHLSDVFFDSFSRKENESFRPFSFVLHFCHSKWLSFMYCPTVVCSRCILCYSIVHTLIYNDEIIELFVQLVATAALFLAAKSEETPCLLNTVLRASCEVSQNPEFAFFPYLFHGVSSCNILRTDNKPCDTKICFFPP